MRTSSPTFLGQPRHGPPRDDAVQGGSAGPTSRLGSASPMSWMFLIRGNPIVYYGDEQGFIGAGGDKDVRQDMPGTQVAQYAAETPSAARPWERRATSGPPASSTGRSSGSSSLRATYPALADGAQVHRLASASAGLFAVSRIDRTATREFLVVLNNSSSAQTASGDLQPGRTFGRLRRFWLEGRRSGRSVSLTDARTRRPWSRCGQADAGTGHGPGGLAPTPPSAGSVVGAALADRCRGCRRTPSPR